MNRQEFHSLLQRYVSGNSSTAEKALVDQWYELLDDTELPPVSEAELSVLEDSLWAKIQDAAIATTPIRTIRFRRIAVAAAVAAIFLTVAAWWYFQRKTSPIWYAGIASTQTMQEKANTTQQVMSILLEDNSKISLYPGASIRYPTHFSTGKREVYLNGQAFFEVHKNPHLPFFVYNEYMTTHVLGTSFMIKPGKEEGLMEVAVRSGRVEVTGNGTKDLPANGIILTPNQQVVYDVRRNRFEASLIEQPEPLPLQPGTNLAKPPLVFEETPLRQVLAAIGSTYGIEIVEENESLDNCPFTGDISGQSLYNMLDLVCQSVKASYEVKGTKILVRGTGCN